MISKEDYLVMEEMYRRGVYKKDIAHELGVHPKTVGRALSRGGAPSGRRPGARRSKLDPYKPVVDQLLSENVWNAEVILRQIQALGYDGKISILRDYIRPKRALRASSSKATVRFETPPGKQMQADWSTVMTRVGGKRSKVHFCVSALGYSRRFYFWCTESEDAHHTYEGVILAFEHFGGVPEEVLVDNQKAAVLKHEPGKVVFAPGFLELARHYGFQPRACRPYRARTKGKDERMVRYIKENFFQMYREFESLEHMNQLAVLWLREVADMRVHGSLKESVSERFKREEQALRPLPASRFDTSYIESRRVAWDGYIDVRGNRYSVPAVLCGQQVRVHIGLDGVLRVFDIRETLVAEHRLKPASEGWSTVASHHRPLWHQALDVATRPLSVYEEVASWN